MLFLKVLVPNFFIKIFNCRFLAVLSWSYLHISSFNLFVFLSISFFDGNERQSFHCTLKNCSSSDDWLLISSLTFLCSCIWDLFIQELFFRFWCLHLLCSWSSSLAITLEEWERFVVLSSYSFLRFSEVFIASMTYLEIWLPSVVIYWPRVSANF